MHPIILFFQNARPMRTLHAKGANFSRVTAANFPVQHAAALRMASGEPFSWENPDLLRLLTVRVESLATVRNPPPTFLPPPDHARCSLPPSLSRPTSCLPPPAYGPP